jgi:hypothetical protein
MRCIRFAIRSCSINLTCWALGRLSEIATPIWASPTGWCIVGRPIPGLKHLGYSVSALRARRKCLKSIQGRSPWLIRAPSGPHDEAPKTWKSSSSTGRCIQPSFTKWTAWSTCCWAGGALKVQIKFSSISRFLLTTLRNFSLLRTFGKGMCEVTESIIALREGICRPAKSSSSLNAQRDE